MSASLVGSEMCIRDSLQTRASTPQGQAERNICLRGADLLGDPWSSDHGNDSECARCSAAGAWA
eukprot:3894271-Alexandrium_andersonii.AAC.1